MIIFVISTYDCSVDVFNEMAVEFEVEIVKCFDKKSCQCSMGKEK